MKTPIYVTKSLLPDRNKFHRYVDRILDSGWLTNRGECVRELELKLQHYLGVKNVVLVSNGTMALQLAYKALNLSGEIITSPFTFIATASSAKWEGLDILFRISIKRLSIFLPKRLNHSLQGKLVHLYLCMYSVIHAMLKGLRSWQKNMG